jgi:hypothetical protein
LGRNPARKRNLIQMLGEARPNPAHRNPWEVRSDSGLEGVFADEDDARFYAEEIRGSGARGVAVELRRRPLHPRLQPQAQARNPSSRLFSGVYPTGIVYADKARERDGDYLRVAFLPFSTLQLEWSPGQHPAELRELIEHDAAQVVARRGQQYPVSSSGQTVKLGKKNPRSMMTGPGWDAARQRLAGAAAGTRKNPPFAIGDRVTNGDEEGTVTELQPHGLVYVQWDADKGRKDTLVWKHTKRTDSLEPVDSLSMVTARNPPNVLPVPGQAIRSWDHGDGSLIGICELGSDGQYTANIVLDSGENILVPLVRTEYDLTPRKALERRTGLSRHEQYIGPPQPDRMPKGTPEIEFDDTVLTTRSGNPAARKRR